MNIIPPVQSPNQSIRYADLVRVSNNNATTPLIYRFATTASPVTIIQVDMQPFNAVGSLLAVGDVQRDIKSTANETTVSLVGIDTALLGWVLNQRVKGWQLECWHIFLNSDGTINTSGGAGGAYKYFTGFINNATISEQWFEETRSFVGTITVSASSTQLILQNRYSGRYTNDNSWRNSPNSLSTDTAMNRVAFIEQINYAFGKDAPANS